MKQVTDRLFVSSLPDAARRRNLEDNEITIIFDVSGVGWQNPWANKFPIFKYPLPDSAAADPAMIKHIVAELVTHYREGQSILIHCLAGQSRSRTLACALLWTTGMSWNDAADLVCDHQAQRETAFHDLVRRMTEDGEMGVSA